MLNRQADVAQFTSNIRKFPLKPNYKQYFYLLKDVTMFFQDIWFSMRPHQFLGDSFTKEIENFSEVKSI